MTITDINFNDFLTKYALEFVAELQAQVQEWVVGTAVVFVKKAGDKVFIAYKTDFDDSFVNVSFIEIETGLGIEEVNEVKTYLIKKTTYTEIKVSVLKDVFSLIV